MEFIIIDTPDDFRAKEIFAAYETTFQPEERRDERMFRQLFGKPQVKVLSVLHRLNNIGYLILWELSEFVFVEHFEIFSEYRSLKYGSEILDHLIKQHTHVALEAEPASFSPDAEKRVKFYEKNGFQILDKEYIQPPYTQQTNSLNLWLMANWQPNSLAQAVEEIYDVVYRR